MSFHVHWTFFKVTIVYSIAEADVEAMRLYETFLFFHAYILFPGKMGSELILQCVDLRVSSPMDFIKILIKLTP